MFLVLEGVDGSGKTTQIRLLARALEKRGLEPAIFKEPGGTPLGESIRSLVLDPVHGDLEPATELFLFMAARSHLVRQAIVPALRAGRAVICDRFLWSSVVYQGMAGGIGVRPVLSLGRLATGGLMPDRTFILDMPARSSLDRKAKQGAENRMERKGRAFQEKVRRGFLRLARSHPRKIVVIDARGTEEEVHERILQKLPRL